VKNFFKVFFILGLALSALNAEANAQTVAMNALGSSAIFLELGLAASSATTATPAGLGATCLWTGSGAVATDNSTGTNLTDTGNAFVAWTPVSGSCTTSGSTTIYAYLQTDSVVGNRCLFNGTHCTVAYPSTNPVPANLILSSGEVNLPSFVASALTSAAIDTAGTDIRPEDAEFAVARALKSCGTAVTTGSQYLGLGYTNGGFIQSNFSTSKFNVINFTLPSTYSVTPLGATPILVVVNSPSATTGFNASTASTNISSSTLSKFLDGTYSYTDQTSSPTGTGAAATVLIREPLSGTYNTMEYNEPNTTTLQTSQDVGVNQPSAQVNCSTTTPGTPASNPMNIATTSGGARQRAIGTGQELSEVISLTSTSGTNTLGYGFWSVGNFKGFTSAAAPYAKYLKIDGIDPLFPSTHTYTGTIPLPGTTDLAAVDLDSLYTLPTTSNYPIWSMLRLVNASSTPTTAVTALAAASQNFVPTGGTSPRPDFVQAVNLSVVRSHFIPPAGTIQPTTAANGKGSLTSSACTNPELGGDVGGVVLSLTADSRSCSRTGNHNGQTGMRR
jgi:hypothetical protein